MLHLRLQADGSEPLSGVPEQVAGGMDQFLGLPQDPLGPGDKHHPLWVEWIPLLPKTPVVPAPETAEANAFVALLRVVVKSFRTRDIVKEFSACQCSPVQEGWAVSSWAPEGRWIVGIPMPDFTACFSIGHNGAFFFKCLGLFTYVDPKVIEASADEAVGPMGNVEYKQLVEKLGGTQKN